MHKHKIDPDLAFIIHLHDDDLVLLASFFFKENKQNRVMEEFKTSSIPFSLATRSLYLDYIFSAFHMVSDECSLVSTFNFSRSLYRHRLQDLCARLNIKDGIKNDIEILELNLLMKLIEKSMNGLNQNDLLIISRDLQLNLSEPTPIQIKVALTAAVKTSNSVALEIATMILRSYLEMCGNISVHQTVELTHHSLMSLKKAVNTTLQSTWLMEAISSPSQSQFPLPIYFIVAYLRQKSFILA
ncbi:TPA: hypothetical protein ACS773_003327 [Providencia alcalifaciens]